MKKIMYAMLCILIAVELTACGGDGSLNPDGTYSDWSWILVRENGEAWKHVDHGYG